MCVGGDGLRGLGGVCDFGHEGAEDGQAGLVFGAEGGFELGLEGGEDGCGLFLGRKKWTGSKEGAAEEGWAGEAEERHIGLVEWVLYDGVAMVGRILGECFECKERP